MKKKILITGSDGLVGSSIKKIAEKYKEKYDFIFANRKSADLTDEKQVEELFKLKPNFVIHTAARVGGIGRNLNSPAQQFRDNILMNTNIIHHSYLNNVEKLICFSSICAFPADLKVITEDELQNGVPYEAHLSYAYSKRMVDIQIEAYKKQYGVNYTSLIPGNIFGEYDNFNLENGHVVPSLIHKIYHAKKENTPFVVWGDGSSTREFLYSYDIARVCMKLLDEVEKMPSRLLVSGKEEISIKDLVSKICQTANYNNIVWDTSKPNGQARRLSDHTLFNKIFPNFEFTEIDEALNITYNWFEKNYENSRK